jgi:hypothetical protein
MCDVDPRAGICFTQHYWPARWKRRANAVHARGKAAQYDFPTRNHLRRQSSMHWSFSAKTVESLPQCPVSVPMQSRVMIEHAFRI